jgi:hypothetical protein
MAEHGAPEYATAAGNDYPAHEQTYEGFIHLAVIGSIHVINTLLGLAAGGVNGNWLIGLLIIFVVAPAAAIHGFLKGSRTSSYIAFGLSLVLFALSA